MSLALVVPECNSLGAALLGGGGLDGAFEPSRAAQRTRSWSSRTICIARPTRPSEALPRGAAHLIVIDHVADADTARADVVPAAGTFAEGDGTFINNEGRAQRFFRVFEPTGDVQEGWRGSAI